MMYSVKYLYFVNEMKRNVQLQALFSAQVTVGEARPFRNGMKRVLSHAVNLYGDAFGCLFLFTALFSASLHSTEGIHFRIPRK